MRRREFITFRGSGGAAAAWPLAARAQQPAMPVIGFVYPGVPELSAGVVAAFRKGLNETGFIEGRNAAVEYRFAYNDNARLPELVADLVQRRVAVIATPASTPTAPGGQSCNHDGSDRLWCRGGPGRDRSGRQPQSSWRECDGYQLDEC